MKLLRQSVGVQELVLFKSLLLSTSRSCKFYSFLLSKIISGNAPSTKSIVYREYQTCHRYSINVSDYLCDTRYFNSCKNDIGGNSHDGLSNAVSFLLHANCANMPIANYLIVLASSNRIGHPNADTCP